MGNFSYDKQTVGKTSVMFEVPSSGTVNVGDLMDSGGAAADASDSAIEFLAQDSTDSGEDILAAPLVSGVSILRGTVNADGGISAGDNVGIDGSQELDADAANSIFLALDDGSAGDVIRVLVTGGL